MKKQQLSAISYVNASLSFIFGVSVFVFFGYFYTYHLAYQEQYQMFLFTSDYMAETTHRVGGLSEYLSRFLTQFYYTPLHGALIIATLLTLMQRQLLSAALHLAGREKNGWASLTFVPSIFYWILLCDENYMLTGVISVIMALSAFLWSRSVRQARVRAACSLIMIPLLYALAGGAVVVFGILFIIAEAVKGGLSIRQRCLTAAGNALLLALSPLSAQYFFPQYPLAKLLTGADYYRYQSVFPFSLLLLWLIIPAIVAGFRLLPAVKKGWRLWLPAGMQGVLLVFLAVLGVSGAADWKKEEVMRYDYYVRQGNWEHIISMADREAPASPLSVAFLNLALCRQGLMPDRMFHYFQNGAEGLLPSFVRDFSIPLMAGEVYYHLGFINTAQRLAFEAMEAIPDFQRSARSIKRLAETSLINGDYEVSRKYLRILLHTLYYSEWAAETLSCLHDEERIEANPEWAGLRKYRTKTDFLFSEKEKDMMLGLLLGQDPSNRPAYEYLMAYCLLTKDMERFSLYYPLGRDIHYRTIPKSYQEALIYIWGLTNNTTAGVPYAVSDEVKRQVEDYRRIYVSYPAAEQMLKSRFSGTYWYYLHYRK
ncbi:MAG: DUF6057 family protein [Tannerellaceae bacterium]|jgi:hypothetical protein|nr:DUF6057 family protein [Tannerellaceae bacterium]